MASQPMAVKLQYMRRAPVPTKATKALRSPEEAISLGENPLKSALIPAVAFWTPKFIKPFKHSKNAECLI